MTSKYEIWYCDDAGRRINLLENIAFFSYARTVSGFSNCIVGLGFDNWVKNIPSVFNPDARIDIWRSPIEGVPTRREKSFWLRKHSVYTRQDGVRMIELFGRDAKDVLRRQYISSFPAAGLTGTIDNIMKYLVTNYVLGTATVPTGELTVDGNSSDGPSITVNYKSRNVLDALNELMDISVTKNKELSTNKKIYFDLEELNSSVNNGFGYRFATYPTLRGKDRTSGLLFSEENGNIVTPTYYEDYLEQQTAFDVFNIDVPAANATATSNDRYLSRWNYIRAGISSSETNVNINQSTANTELQKAAAAKVMNVSFVNSPGGPTQPRSLYGVDWDLGDLLPVKYAGIVFNTEVQVVYVSVNDKGEEMITGRSLLGE